MDIDWADYTLLNAVSLEEWQIYLLGGDVLTVMNVEPHDLEIPELTEHFFGLWRRGLVECSLEYPNWSPERPDLALLREQFDGIPSLDRLLMYRLSAAGASLWENPDQA